jgi:hypothetical protein
MQLLCVLWSLLGRLVEMCSRMKELHVFPFIFWFSINLHVCAGLLVDHNQADCYCSTTHVSVVLLACRTMHSSCTCLKVSSAGKQDENPVHISKATREVLLHKENNVDMNHYLFYCLIFFTCQDDPQAASSFTIHNTKLYILILKKDV